MSCSSLVYIEVLGCSTPGGFNGSTANGVCIRRLDTTYAVISSRRGGLGSFRGWLRGFLLSISLTLVIRCSRSSWLNIWSWFYSNFII